MSHYSSSAQRSRQLASIAHAGRRKERGGIDDAMAEQRARSRTHAAEKIDRAMFAAMFAAMRDKLDAVGAAGPYVAVVPQNLFAGLSGQFNGITIREAP